jgi:hypothetical protein
VPRLSRLTRPKLVPCRDGRSLAVWSDKESCPPTSAQDASVAVKVLLSDPISKSVLSIIGSRLSKGGDPVAEGSVSSAHRNANDESRDLVFCHDRSYGLVNGALQDVLAARPHAKR